MRARALGGRDPALGMRRDAALGVALAAAGGVALVVVLFLPRARWPHLLVYDTPIALPFVLWLLERWHGLGAWRGRAAALDVGVVGVALVRPASLALGAPAFPPYVSGHALFLTYAAITTRSGLVRVAALLVLAQVAWMKVFLWGDPSLLGGALLGTLAALARRTR